MYLRLILCLAVLGLAFLPGPVRAQAPADKPTLMVRINALDELLADARYLAKVAGREEEVKQLEGFLKAKTGPKGLEGIDNRKPLGLYGLLKSKIDESQLVVLLPIADEKTFLGLLENLDLKVEKSKDGLHTIQLPQVPFPIIFRFGNGYLYGTAKVTESVTLDPKTLPAPADALAGGEGAALTITGNLDAIPAQAKALAETTVALGLGNAKNQVPPGETEAQKKFRETALDETASLIKKFLRDATAMTLKINVDRKNNDLTVSLDLTAKNGSTLAGDIAALAPGRSLGAGLIRPDALLSGSMYLALPESLRKTFGGVIDEGFTKALEAEKDKEKRELASVLLDALKPTAKEGVIDSAFAVTEVDKDGKANLVAGLRLTEGDRIEKAVRKIMPELPPAERKKVKLDVAKVGEVNIHQVANDMADERSKELFGTGPAYFAIRKDALLLAFGPRALDVLKEGLEATPKEGAPLRVEMSIGRLAPLMARDRKAAPVVAKKVFTEKGSDRVSLTVEAGKALQVKFTTKTQVIAFASQLDRLEKGGDKEK